MVVVPSPGPAGTGFGAAEIGPAGCSFSWRDDGLQPAIDRARSAASVILKLRGRQNPKIDNPGWLVQRAFMTRSQVDEQNYCHEP